MNSSEMYHCLDQQVSSLSIAVSLIRFVSQQSFFWSVCEVFCQNASRFGQKLKLSSKSDSSKFRSESVKLWESLCTEDSGTRKHEKRLHVSRKNAEILNNLECVFHRKFSANILLVDRLFCKERRLFQLEDPGQVCGIYVQSNKKVFSVDISTESSTVRPWEGRKRMRIPLAVAPSFFFFVCLFVCLFLVNPKSLEISTKNLRRFPKD